MSNTQRVLIAALIITVDSLTYAEPNLETTMTWIAQKLTVQGKTDGDRHRSFRANRCELHLNIEPATGRKCGSVRDGQVREGNHVTITIPFQALNPRLTKVRDEKGTSGANWITMSTSNADTAITRTGWYYYCDSDNIPRGTKIDEKLAKTQIEFINDDDFAERLNKAVQHGIKLCGGRDKEAF